MMYKIYYMDRHHNPVNYTFVKANSLEEAYIKAKDSEPFLPTKHNFKYAYLEADKFPNEY